MTGIRDGLVFPINPPSIPGLGSTGGFDFYIQSRSGGSALDLERVTKTFLAAAREMPELASVSSTFSASQRQLALDVDRTRAELLGIPVAAVFETLQSYFGSTYVGQFVQFGRIWQVIIQAEADYRDDPADLDQIFLRSKDNLTIPLSSAATALKTLPEGYSLAWAGQAFEEKKAGGTALMAFVFGLIMVFLILAAQYEKWTLPLSVVLSVPFAVGGALLMTWLLGLQNDVYFQVGLVTLVGLSAKKPYSSLNLPRKMSGPS